MKRIRDIQIAFSEEEKIRALKTAKRKVEKELNYHQNLSHKVFKNKKKYNRKNKRYDFEDD